MKKTYLMKGILRVSCAISVCHKLESVVCKPVRFIYVCSTWNLYLLYYSTLKIHISWMKYLVSKILSNKVSTSIITMWFFLISYKYLPDPVIILFSLETFLFCKTLVRTPFFSLSPRQEVIDIFLHTSSLKDLFRYSGFLESHNRL